MRILQLCNRVPWPPHGGGAIATLNMTRAFYNLGHELHLLCLNTKKLYINPAALPEMFHKLASFKEVYINTDVNALRALVNVLFSKKSYNVSRF